MPEMHPVEAVAEGVSRFLDLFRTASGADAEPEFADLCLTCNLYPPAVTDGRCFSCVAAQRFPA